MINENELRKERDYLRNVLYILEREISKKTNIYNEIESNIQKEMKYIWENKSDDTEVTSVVKAINEMEGSTNALSRRINAYSRMINSAYFARIDFDDGEEVLPIYLGIATLEDGGHFYIYDWRAPICSMFYDFEMGDASYTLPNGTTIKGKIVVKRQYKISGDKIEEIFDTDLQIIDDILKNMLTNNASLKMKNIVKTIQKDQNKVIRKNDVDILIVQGPAGSGKTSVALHRVAYLLYSEKESLKNSNILILSPNDVFSDYISDVLPQIGEENVYQTTFMDYVRSHINEYKVKGSMEEIYEELFLCNGENKSVKYNSIKLKFSASYINLMENLIQENRNELLGVKDIVIDGKVIISSDFLQKYAQDMLKSNLSIIEEANLILEKVKAHLDIKLYKDIKTKTKILKLLKMNLTKIKAKTLQSQLFENAGKFVQNIERVYNESGTPKINRLTIKQLKEVYEYTYQNISKNILPYEDVIPYLYLKDRLVGTFIQRNIKQVVIDEAQDYTLMQYQILSHAFRDARITLLGDLNQSILPFANYKNYESILNLLKNDRIAVTTDMHYLTKTYRSTAEISKFANNIVAEKANITNHLERHGDEVSIILDKGKGASSQLANDAVELKKIYKTVAIIFKTEKEVLEFKKDIAGSGINSNFKFMVKGEKDFTDSCVMVLASYIAKGLEFDAVLVAGANKDVYTKQEKNIFYVVCTRALHKLNIYYTDEPTEFIPSAL